MVHRSTEKESYRQCIKGRPLDYATEDFADCIVIKGRFPMEMMNYFDELHMNKVISILTVVDSIEFADEKIKLGNDFMDEYEAPELHRQNEQI